MVRRSRFVFFSLLLAACEGPAASPLVTSAADDEALAALEAETGRPWELRRDPVLGTPAFLEGRTRPVAATPRDAERAAIDFLSRHRALFHMRDPSAELASTSSEGDELGCMHARFVQRVGRVPVYGAYVAVHFDPDGTLVRVNGRYVPIVAPELEPRVTAAEARVGAAALARGQRVTAAPNDFTTRETELVLYPTDDGEPGAPQPARLAWHTVVDVASADPLQLDAIIDATDGTLLASYDRLLRMVGSGVGYFGDRKPLMIEQKKTAYWLEDRTRGTTPTRTFSARNRAKLPGSQLQSRDPQRWDAVADAAPGAAVDAHAHVATTWDYFEREHGRIGWTADGEGIRTSVHFGERYGGAFFDGAQLVFGDGDERMDSPSAALDLVAHEYTHGLIAATAGLYPYGASGAIGEGLADVFACLVAGPSGQGARWQIGEAVYHADTGRNRPLRDLARPQLTSQPEALSEIVATRDDAGGIHVNASIVGHLGYLLVEGDRPRGLRSLGAPVVGRLLYRALVTYLFPRAGYAELADALVAAARDLGGAIEPDVLAALVAVGLR